MWVYGWEAHPSEDPFPGVESADLGWDHPYSNTTSMEERAQRAKWLKTDPEPDLEIPAMIDYINDSPNANNAIKYAYLGGGYYSGFVIDCDGKVIKKVDWGWFNEGTDWMTLPLEHIDVLHSFLDDYLDDPPECFVPPAGDTDTDADGGSDSGSIDNAGGDESCGCSSVGSPSTGLARLVLSLFS